MVASPLPASPNQQPDLGEVPSTWIEATMRSKSQQHPPPFLEKMGEAGGGKISSGTHRPAGIDKPAYRALHDANRRQPGWSMRKCIDDIISIANRMKRKIPFLMLLLSLALVFGLAAFPVNASPQQPQAYYYTPTANADGRITYIVQPGDTCISISLLNNITLDDLRMLNNLDEDCTLMEGKELLLGIYKETTPTVGFEATPTPLLALATPFSGNAEVCVVLFLDINGNAMAEENEPSLAGGAVSLTNPLGTFSRTGETTAWGMEEEPTPLCFDDVPEGEYYVSVAVPDEYNATTVVNYTLSIKPGDRALLDFGAQPKGQSQAALDGDGEGGAGSGSSPLLAVFGVLLLLVGIGLGVYVRWLSKHSSRQ